MHTFYCENIPEGTIYLSNDESKHCIKVLRLRRGDQIEITDGKGKIVLAELQDENHKSVACRQVQDISPRTIKKHSIHVVIAPTKNIDRMEWFVEKSGEIGVDQISFIKTQNSERPTLKLDRLKRKAISAMKQAKSGRLVQLNELISFKAFIQQDFPEGLRFIAAVKEGLPYFSEVLKPNTSTVVMIGPEGDFTVEEINETVKAGFQPVSLGENVLRTETAGIVGAQFINLINKF